MGSLEAAPRHRDPLPSIGFLGKDGSGFASKHHAATATLLSPNNMPSSQQLPFGYPPPTSQSGHISPPESRRATLEDENDKVTPRQSLPSIHEALHMPLLSPTSASQSQPGQTSSQSHLIGGSRKEGPTGLPNPFLNGPPSGPLMRDSSYPHQGQLQPENRNSLTSINTPESRNASLQSLSTNKSPTQSAKTGLTSISGSQNSSGYEYSAAPSAGGTTSPNAYTPFPPSYSFPNGSSYPSAPYDNRSYVGPPRVKEEVTGGTGPGQHYSESIKRHLDAYDVETSLKEITDMSQRTLAFSQHYAERAYQTQRAGPAPGSLPSLGEVEDMLHMQRRNQDALIRIRTAVVNQEQALAEQQMAQRKAFKPGEEGHLALYQEELKGADGFVGADSKKRRGKAAAPGRCHSCNRGETPEWRRGPDGARTLCNACGLHYAKVSRKYGPEKAAALIMGFKPKMSLDSTSPISY